MESCSFRTTLMHSIADMVALWPERCSLGGEILFQSMAKIIVYYLTSL